MCIRDRLWSPPHSLSLCVNPKLASPVPLSVLIPGVLKPAGKPPSHSLRRRTDPSRAEHRLHLRRELCHPDIFSVSRDLVENPLVRLVSVMDHSPGRRQFVLESKYREYYMSKYHLTTTQMDEFITLRHLSLIHI